MFGSSPRKYSKLMLAALLHLVLTGKSSFAQECEEMPQVGDALEMVTSIQAGLGCDSLPTATSDNIVVPSFTIRPGKVGDEMTRVFANPVDIITTSVSEDGLLSFAYNSSFVQSGSEPASVLVEASPETLLNLLVTGSQTIANLSPGLPNLQTIEIDADNPFLTGLVDRGIFLDVMGPTTNADINLAVVSGSSDREFTVNVNEGADITSFNLVGDIVDGFIGPSIPDLNIDGSIINQLLLGGANGVASISGGCNNVQFGINSICQSALSTTLDVTPDPCAPPCSAQCSTDCTSCTIVCRSQTANTTSTSTTTFTSTTTTNGGTSTFTSSSSSSGGFTTGGGTGSGITLGSGGTGITIGGSNGGITIGGSNGGITIGGSNGGITIGSGSGGGGGITVGGSTGTTGGGGIFGNVPGFPDFTPFPTPSAFNFPARTPFPTPTTFGNIAGGFPDFTPFPTPTALNFPARTPFPTPTLLNFPSRFPSLGGGPSEPDNGTPSGGGIGNLFGGGFCFSGNNVVQVKGKGETWMDDLKVGDEVLVDDKNNKYETVYTFAHRDERMNAEFLQFLPSKLELSPNHLVSVVNRGMIPASMVKVGDVLESSGNAAPVQVIQQVERTGVYTPFTRSGKIVVNGIVSSNYIALQSESQTLKIKSWSTPLTFQWLDHAMVAPHRMWCSMFGSENVNEEGFSPISLGMYKWGMWFLNLDNAIVMGLLLIPIVGAGTVFLALESMVSNVGTGILGLVVAAAALYMMARRRANKKAL